MPKVTPENRACLEFATYVVIGLDPADEVYVFRDGKTYLSGGKFWEVSTLDPAGDQSGYDALLIACAQAIEAHLSGIELAQVRRDLLEIGVGEKLADRVLDHVAEISVGEWARLRERVDWYGDDNASHIAHATEDAGVT